MYTAWTWILQTKFLYSAQRICIMLWSYLSLDLFIKLQFLHHSVMTIIFLNFHMFNNMTMKTDDKSDSCVSHIYYSGVMALISNWKFTMQGISVFIRKCLVLFIYVKMCVLMHTCWYEELTMVPLSIVWRCKQIL